MAVIRRYPNGGTSGSNDANGRTVGSADGRTYVTDNWRDGSTSQNNADVPFSEASHEFGDAIKGLTTPDSFKSSSGKNRYSSL